MAFHAFMSLCVFLLYLRFLLQNVFLKLVSLFSLFSLSSTLSVSRFLVPSRQRNYRKSFHCHGKYFGKETFRAPAWTSAKFYCGNKTGNRERAVSLPLARSGSQSQRGIWFILPTHGASHIINIHIHTHTHTHHFFFFFELPDDCLGGSIKL